MLNILSLKDERKRFRVTIDMLVENAICVHMDDGGILKFKEVESGIYFLSSSNNFNKQKVSVYSYITLVKANKSNFTRRQLRKADMAREFREKIGYPGNRKSFKLLEINYFRNFPLPIEDAKRSLHKHGPDVEILKGKTVKRRTDVIQDMTRVGILETLKDLHPHIYLSADNFFVQGIAFLYSISRGYDFRTVGKIKDFGKWYSKLKMITGI